MNLIIDYLDDILTILGLGLITVATYKLSPIAAMFLVGVILMIAGLLIGKQKSYTPPVHNQREEAKTDRSENQIQ